MSFKSKLTEHIKEAERWQSRVLGFEKAAARQESDPIAQARLLDRFDYRSAVSNRNGHQQQAVMYGLAALLEELTGQRLRQQFENPRQIFSSPPLDDGL